MKSKQSLMAVLVGLAMIAMPVAAAAGDHGQGENHGSHEGEQGRSFNRVERHEARNHNDKPRYHGEPDNDNYRYAGNQSWRNHENYPAARYGNDDNDYESGAGYQGQYYAPSYYGGANGEPGRLLAARAQIGVRIARARARGDWRTVNNGYRELRVVNAQLARVGVRRNNRAYNAAPAYLSPYANLGGYAGVPAYNNYGNNSGYNNGYNAPNYNNPYGGGALSQLAPLLQLVH